MPIGSFIEQPTSNLIKAAYRPIVIRVNAARTDNNPIPPVVYCDIYFNDKFYKTLSATQYLSVGSSHSQWQFDIQDAAQEYLTKFLADNGFQGLTQATPIILKAFCKLRSSGLNSDGFTIPEGTAPIQGTFGVEPISGTGTSTNTFYIVNCALQHEDNQNLDEHLNSYKNQTWGGSTYPLTHRPNHYKLCVTDSDAFPLLTDKIIADIILHYLPAGGAVWQTQGGVCLPVQWATSPPSIPDAEKDVPYVYSLTLLGTPTFAFLGSPTKPAWMTIAIVGNEVQFSGTPTAAATDVQVSFTISNCSEANTALFFQLIDVIEPPVCVPLSFDGSTTIDDAVANVPYVFSILLAGDAPYTLSSIVKPAWMTISVSGNEVFFQGTPSSGDIGTNIPVSFTLSNCSGANSINLSELIDVTLAPPGGRHLQIEEYTGSPGTITGDCTFNGSIDRSIGAKDDAVAANETVRVHFNASADNACGVASSVDFLPSDLSKTFSLDVSCGGTPCSGGDITITLIEII